MKKTILSFILIFGFLVNTAIAQEIDQSPTVETPEAFCKKLARIIIANNKAGLRTDFPTTEEFVNYLVVSGESIDDIIIESLEKKIERNFKVYQEQIEGLRKAAEDMGFNWNKAAIENVIVEKIEETNEEKDNPVTLISYKIEINFTSNNKQLTIYSERVFESSNGFKILGISNWGIN